MSKPKSNTPVVVTVRPDGTYYVERPSIAPLKRAQVMSEGQRPVSATIRSTLAEVAGIAVAVKTVAPSLGPYGTLAALGFGMLRALATPEPPPRQVRLRQVRIPKGVK